MRNLLVLFTLFTVACASGPKQLSQKEKIMLWEEQAEAKKCEQYADQMRGDNPKKRPEGWTYEFSSDYRDCIKINIPLDNWERYIPNWKDYQPS